MILHAQAADTPAIMYTLYQHTHIVFIHVEIYVGLVQNTPTTDGPRIVTHTKRTMVVKGACLRVISG